MIQWGLCKQDNVFMAASSIHGCVNIKYKAVRSLMMNVTFAKCSLKQNRDNRFDDCL